MPIHYVGAQCHDDLSFYTDFPGYIDSVKRYSRSIVELGVQWHFTEITIGVILTYDVRTFSPKSREKGQSQLISVSVKDTPRPSARFF